MARQFGHTWWGRAWVEALEGRARLDPNRLPRGRTYARQDRVEEMEVNEGRVEASVWGTRSTPYEVRLEVRLFSTEEWDRLLSAIAGRATHAAALLDGELVPEILDDADAAGVTLLAGPGDLTPRCSCPDWADPCKHSAAVCYLVAEILDDDPFALLLLRGRSREQVLAEVRERRRRNRAERAGRHHDPTMADSGETGTDETPAKVSAREIWNRDSDETGLQDTDLAAELARLAAVEPPRTPGEPPALAVPPPAGSGVDALELRQLAVDAAERAAAMLRGEQTSALAMDPDSDLARRAALLMDRPAELLRLARSSGRAPEQLELLARAWQAGGTEGLWVLENSWDATTGDEEIAAGLDEAREALTDLTGIRPRRRANRVTAGNHQLRVAPSGNWYHFVRIGSVWTPASAGHGDPAAGLDLT